MQAANGGLAEPRGPADDDCRAALDLHGAGAYRRRRRRRDSVSANSSSGSVNQRTSSSPAADEVALQALGRELRADLGAHLLAGVEVHGQVQRAHERGVLAARAQAHLDPLVLAVEQGDVVEVLGVEVGVQLAVEHAQHVAVELGGDALRVVVGGLEHLRVLDQVGAHQQVVLGAEQAGDLAQHAPAAAGREVADRAAEERHDARSDGGRHAVEMTLEVADHAVHLQARVLARSAPRRSRAPCSR